MANTLFCTICDNHFVPGCRVMLYSLQRHFQGFEGADVKVLFDDQMSELSESSQSAIRDVAPNVQFVNVDNPIYRSAKVRDERLRPAYLSLEVFRETEYDHVFYVDSDMLCTEDFSHLMANEGDCDFMACAAWRDGDNPFQSVGIHDGRWAERSWFGLLGRRRLIVNAGFFWAGRSLRTQATYESLMHYVSRHSSGRGLADQWAINTFFGCRNTRLNLLPDGYNWRDIRGYDTCPDPSQVKILHYVGGRGLTKPWAPDAPRDLRAFEMWDAYAAACNRETYQAASA